MTAARHGQIRVIDLLLERGAGRSCRDARRGWTPLHVAAAGGHGRMVAVLLAAPNTQRHGGKRSLKAVRLRSRGFDGARIGRACGLLLRQQLLERIHIAFGARQPRLGAAC